MWWAWEKQKDTFRQHNRRDSQTAQANQKVQCECNGGYRVSVMEGTGWVKQKAQVG